MVQVIVTVIIVMLSVINVALTCRDPEYLAHLKNQVRPFYEFYEDQNGHHIARPKWPVSIVVNNYNSRSTCPWSAHVNVDTNRFPVRLLSARSVTPPGFNSIGIYPCLREQSERYQRHEGKMCQPISQIVPVVNLNLHSYTITNTSIIVGYTCAFDE